MPLPGPGGADLGNLNMYTMHTPLLQGFLPTGVRSLVLICLLAIHAAPGVLPQARAGETGLVVTDGDFPPPAPAKEALGRLLFFDKLLSGNRDIACSTCHHPLLALGDGLSLPIGAGGSGLGPSRQPFRGEEASVGQRVPRHAPALFNLGATQFTTLFLDGHLSVDRRQPSGRASTTTPSSRSTPASTPIAGTPARPATSSPATSRSSAASAVIRTATGGRPTRSTTTSRATATTATPATRVIRRGGTEPWPRHARLPSRC